MRRGAGWEWGVEGVRGEGGWGLECLPPVASFILHDSWAPPQEHELHILNISFQALHDWQAHTPHRRPSPRLAPLHSHPSPPLGPVPPLHPPVVYADALFRQYPAGYAEGPYRRDLPPPVNVSTLLCLARVSFSPMYGLLTESAYDWEYWRVAAMGHYGLPLHHHPVPPLLVPRVAPPVGVVGQLGGEVGGVEAAVALLACPPARAILVLRPDRMILNSEALIQRLYERFYLRVEAVTVDATTPSRDQAAMFAGAGLVLSAHSSQLINVLFSARGQAMVEVTAEFYNLDFAQYARGVGVHFRYAVGGEVEGGVEAGEKMAACVRGMRERCVGGDPWCVERVRDEVCREERSFPNKYRSFHADLDAVERAVRQSLGHVMRQCYERWQPQGQQVQLTKLTKG